MAPEESFQTALKQKRSILKHQYLLNCRNSFIHGNIKTYQFTKVQFVAMTQVLVDTINES